MLDVAVIDDPAAAMAALDPIKARLLAELSQPASAAALAARVGLPRQKVNYHLRALEQHHLVEPSEERRWGGLTERLMVATAAIVRRVPRGPGTGRRRSGSQSRSPLGQLPDRAGRPHHPGGERPVARSARRPTSDWRRSRSTR